MKWYQHQTDAHRDTKIKKLINEHGAEGYAVYFYCLELIAGDLDGENITFELEDDAELIGQALKVDTLKVERIMKKCLELDLFGITEDGTITCIKMAKFLSAEYTRNPKLKKIITSSKFDRIKRKSVADSLKTVSRLSQTSSATVPNLSVPNPTVPDPIFITRMAVSDLNERTGESYDIHSKAIQKLVGARIKEGHGLDQFMTVNENMVHAWKGKRNKDFNGDEHLNPFTLYSSKFEKYLNMKPRTPENEKERIMAEFKKDEKIVDVG